MRPLAIRLLVSFVVLFIPSAVFAHGVTISGPTTFAAIDGSADDHDGTVNGVFTVSDGDLVINGTVNCNDDTTTNACSMAFSASGDIVVDGALYAENRSGGGTGGAINLSAGRDLLLGGSAIVSSSSKSSSGATGGNITATVSRNVSLAAGSTIDAGSANARAGNITISAGGLVSVDGNVLSGPSRTILAASRLTGAALDGGTSNQIGGEIRIISSTFAEPALIVGSNANIVSQGDVNGAGPVILEGCGIAITGHVAALGRKDSATKVSIRSGKDLLIDSQDLGVAGATLGRNGRVRSDATTGTSINRTVEILATETVTVLGPASASSSLFPLTSLAGLHDAKSVGGLIRIVSTEDAVIASGNVADDGRSASGDTGGPIDIAAKGDVNLATAVIRSFGDSSTNNPARGGGSIAVRSYSGNVNWTNGMGDVRPTGSASGLPPSDQGTITLTACGTVTTTGSSFPVNGSPTGPWPAITTGACSPASPSLPAGVVLVTCNTPPVANDAAATTNEDTTVTITLSGTDADGDSLTFSIVSGPSNGVLGAINQVDSTSATVDYTPNLNFNGSDSFVYRANDGNGGTDDATVAITVVAVNDPPSFLAGPTVISLEDAGAQSYPNWATSISAGPADESGQTVTFFVSNDNPGLFLVQPSVDSNGTLTYTANANAHGTANLSIYAQDNGGTANGGDDTSATQSSSITVDPVNDAPSFTKGADQTVAEDAGPQTVSPWATGISAGPNEGTQNVSFVVSNNNNSLFSTQPAVASDGTLTYTPAADANGSAVVTVYAQDDGGTANGGVDSSAPQTFNITVSGVNDAPSFTAGGNVTVDEDSGAYSAAWATAISAGPADESTQNVTFSVTNNNNALFSVQPAVASDGTLTFTLNANAFGSANVTVTATDDGVPPASSAPQSFTITVTSVNDEPTFTAGGNVNVNEDSGAYSASWATGISAGPNEGSQTLTFNVSNDNNSLFSSQPAIDASGVLTFSTAANAFGTATVTVVLTDDGGTANGGDDTSSTATFTITIDPVNDAPSFTGGGDVTVLEDSAPYSAAWATGISAGPANESGQTLTFNVSNNNNSLFSVQPSISAGGVLSFTLNANAFGSATVTVTLSDDGGTANGGADTSAAQTFTITVSPVNDAPSFVGGGDVTVNEDSGPYAASWATSISAGPNETQTVAFNVSNNNNALFLVQPSITSTGVLSFTPALNAFGSATVTVTLSDNGGTANGGVDTSAAQTFTINVTGVNDGPTAGNDSWETLGNTELRVDLPAAVTAAVNDTTPSGNGVRDNDSDPEGDPMIVTGIVGCSDSSAPFDCTLGDGSKVSMLANGSFSYTPGPGNTSGSFQYTTTDIPSAGTPVTTTGTVSITIHDRIWYVNGSAAPGGNGTSRSPFNNFVPLNGGSDVDVPGDTIFVHASSVIGSIAVEANQKLWGEGVGLSKPNNLNGNGSPTVLVAPGMAPIVTAATDTVTVMGVSGVEIAGLTLISTNGNGINVTSTPLGSPAGATIYKNHIAGATEEGIEVNAGSSSTNTVTIANVVIDSTGNGLDATTLGDLLISVANLTVTSGSTGVMMTAPIGGLTVTGFSNVSVHGNTAGTGINITGVTFDAIPGGTFDAVITGSMDVGSSGNAVGGAGVILGNVSGDLNVGNWLVYGSTTGVTVTGSGLYSGAAGMRLSSSSGAISAAAGAGLSVTNTTIGSGNLNFTSISSSGGASGIILNNTDTTGGLKVIGTGAANSGGVIQSTTSHGILLTSTQSPSFAWMLVQNTAGSGVEGTSVDGFTFTNGQIENSGTGGGVGDSNIAFNNSSGSLAENNLSGAVTITNNVLKTARYHAIDILNYSGTITSANISGNTITSSTLAASSLGNAITMNFDGSAGNSASLTAATIANNVISNFPSGAGIRIDGGNSSAAGPSNNLGTPGSSTDVVSITGNEIQGSSAAVRMGTQAINVTVSGKGVGNVDVSDNGSLSPITNINGAVINLAAFGQSTVEARVADNAIVANNVLASSGISVGVDQQFAVTDAPSMTIDVLNNSVSAVNGSGILAVARNSNGTMRAKIQNNTVAAPTGGVRQGIRVDSGTAAGNTNVCLNISGNTSAGSGGTTGIGIRKQGTNPAINVFGVNGMAATSTPAVEAYINSQNPSGGGTLLLSATTGFTNCSLP